MTFASRWAKLIVLIASLVMGSVQFYVLLKFVAPPDLQFVLPVMIAAVRGAMIGAAVVLVPYATLLLVYLFQRPQVGESNEPSRAFRSRWSAGKVASTGHAAAAVENELRSPDRVRWLLRSVALGVIGAALWHSLLMKSQVVPLPLGSQDRALAAMSSPAAEAVEGAKEVRRTIRALGGWFGRAALSGIAGVVVGLGLGFSRRRRMTQAVLTTGVFSILTATHDARLLPSTLSGHVGVILFFFCALGSASLVWQLQEICLAHRKARSDSPDGTAATALPS